jgi:hypothetical protein
MQSKSLLNVTNGKNLNKMLVFVGLHDDEQFKDVTDDEHFIKPKGGLWTSPYIVDKGSEWISWCIDANFNITSKIEEDCPISFISLKDKARILVINSFDDLCNTLSEYKRTERQACLDKMDGGVMDFEKVMKDFDAIYLTSDGQWKTRLTRPGLYGWDVETVYIMNKKAIKHVKFGTIEGKWIQNVKKEHDDWIASLARPITNV